jgi:hypothetical protein
MSGTVNLLLLLSALLSALTGVGASARQPQVAQAVAQQAQAAATVSRPAVAHRPLIITPSLATFATEPVAVALHIAAAEPLFASRRRE